MMEFNGGSLSADHLCVLVHGLWGNPTHMNQVAKSLRAAYSEDELYLLLAKRNSDSYTYDGIELGGERVCLEIEEEIKSIREKGGNITKLSIVGYSLGGLVARYAVGLLYARGILDKVQPVNFTTFATPHLGVKAPLRSWYTRLWNSIGANTLSESGRQLFIIDKFRHTGRPLLSVMADHDSIFLLGLKKFKRRILYSNVVNDRSVPYFTSMITKTDPYADLTAIQANYAKGYEDVVLDQTNPVMPLADKSKSTHSPQSASGLALSYIKTGAYLLALAILTPIGLTAFFLNSVVQTIRSSRRIQLHEMGLAGIQVDDYRMPFWVQEIEGAVENALENLNSLQKEDTLSFSEEEDSDGNLEVSGADGTDLERQRSHSSFPTLALAPSQFSMITTLNRVGWRKHPIWIHEVRHTHAAIIVRVDKPSFSEGRVVMKHWLEEEFLQ